MDPIYYKIKNGPKSWENSYSQELVPDINQAQLYVYEHLNIILTTPPCDVWYFCGGH